MPFGFLRWHWILVLAVLLLTATLQIVDLDKISLWADEGWTIAATLEDNPVDVLTEWVSIDVHPPLFFLELYVWRQFTGDTIFEMRYFSVLITLLATAVMYKTGQSLFNSKLAGILAAFIFGVHDLVNVLTQEVRHYPQQQLTVALTLWMFWRYYKRPTRERGIAFTVAGALLIWSHYWGGLVLISIAIFTLITRRQQLKPYLLSFAGIGLLFAPWLPALYAQITYERPDGLPHALENSWLVYKTLAFQIMGIPEFFWLALAAFGLVGTAFTANRFDWTKINPASGLLFLIIVITTGLSIGFNEFYPTLSFRSLAVVIPPLAALAAFGLMLFRPRERLVLVIFVIVQSLFTTSAKPVERAPWPDVSRFLAQHSTEEDVILFELDTDEYNVEYYLNQQTDRVTFEHTETDRERLGSDYNLQDVLRGEDSVWMAKLDWYYYDIRSDLTQLGFTQVSPVIAWDSYLGRPIEVIRYERLPDEDVEPVLTVGESFALYRSDITIHPEWVTVNLLWQPQENLDDFYTVSVFLLHESGQILTPESQHDSYPLDGKSPTIDWTARQFYFDSHALMTEDLPAGQYKVGLKIYRPLNGDYSNLEILAPSDCADEACTYAILEVLTLE
ncbi:MAG: glycosyltransferase family 39 protein [Chloroflexi bacterium]|nr:glycosyltransferase family 39 protein [Chloroflexota bacterium]